MYPHRIRLRAPWQAEPLAGGGVRYRRGFGLPRRVDDFERVDTSAEPERHVVMFRVARR